MDNVVAQIEAMIEKQVAKLIEVARHIVPYATYEDVLQPQDFPDLEQDPRFRYEEGILYGLERALAALRVNTSA